MAINYEYADLVFKRNEFANKKLRSTSEEVEYLQIGTQLTKMELQMSAQDIILSIQEAFKHIPSRE